MATRVLLFFAACVCACVHGRITHRHISLDNRDHFQVERKFGFDKTGVVQLKVTNLKAFSLQKKPSGVLSQFGFFLASPMTLSQVETDQNHGTCYLEDAHLMPLMNFTQWTNTTKELDSELKFSDHDFLEPGEYILYYADCDPETSLSFDVRIVMYNVGPNGAKDYLSVGDRPLPTIHMLCYTERRHVHGIHYLMFGLVVLRAVVYFTEAGMYHDDRVAGSPDGWNVAFYVFTFLRGVMFFVVIVLIGTGWSYLRPYIGDNEKKVLIVVIPLQIFANIAIIVLEETSPARTTFVTLTDLFHLVDIICCCAILFPIVWSIKHLREGAESDGKAAVNVEKLTLFRQFYVLVVVYIYFTRIIVYLLDSTLPYDYKWASVLASEVATLAFYVTVGTKFRPHGENLYLKLETDAAL